MNSLVSWDDWKHQTNHLIASYINSLFYKEIIGNFLSFGTIREQRICLIDIHFYVFKICLVTYSGVTSGLRRWWMRLQQFIKANRVLHSLMAHNEKTLFNIHIWMLAPSFNSSHIEHCILFQGSLIHHHQHLSLFSPCKFQFVSHYL